LIIGILTETNQFIMISEPTENIFQDGLVEIKDENYIISDKVLSQKKEEDPLRIETIKKITLETQFYSSFRSTIRILLNQIINKNYKNEIMDIIENPRLFHKDKIQIIEKIVKKMSTNYIDFRIFDILTLMNLDEITDCFTNQKEKQYCIIQDNGEQQLIIPEKHLISGLSNKKIYFSRIADELIRYKRIQQYLLDSKTYLNITDSDYKINENEMIMLESLLTSDYFKSLEPYQHLSNSKITYEIANPLKTQKYTNEITLDMQRELEQENIIEQDENYIECVQEKRDVIGNQTNIWKKIFPKTVKEVILNKSIKCSFYPILHVFKKIYGKVITIENIREKLVNEYSKYIDRGYYERILSILRKQGKKEMIDNIRSKKMSLQDYIASEVYFLTNLDIWILAVSIQLPIILFSSFKLKNFLDTENWIRLYDDKKNKNYFYIRVPIEPNEPGNYLPQYHMILPSVPNIKTETKITLEKYLQLYTTH